MKSIQNKTTRKMEKVGNVYIENVTIEYELDDEGLQQRIDMREKASKGESNINQKKIFEDDIKYFKEVKTKGKGERILIQSV